MGMDRGQQREKMGQEKEKALYSGLEIKKKEKRKPKRTGVQQGNWGGNCPDHHSSVEFFALFLGWGAGPITVVKEHCPVGVAEMQLAGSIATAARNDEVNETGFSPSQWILGRQRTIPEDVLNRNVMDNPGEHGALELPRYALRIAMLETAKPSLLTSSVPLLDRRLLWQTSWA